MILDFKHYRERGAGKTFKILGKAFFSQLFGAMYSRRYLGVHHIAMAPRLKRDEKGNSFCISCELCSKTCPTQAIDIKIDKNIQMPTDLKMGPAPMEFAINDELCVRCSLCVEVCPVDALIAGDF